MLIAGTDHRVHQQKRRISNKCEGVEVEELEDSIIFTTPYFKEKAAKMNIKKEERKTLKKIDTSRFRSVESQTMFRNKQLEDRCRRGQTDWDCFVVVTELQPKNSSLGVPNEMDICNYFLHNHKHVADVKFLSWTHQAVVVKFVSEEAESVFLGLDYVMFYGTELVRKNVPVYLKSQSDNNKNEVSQMCLNKNYEMTKTGREEDTSLYVEMTGLSSQSSDIRGRFIENLNLTEKVVGKVTWENSKARMVVRLPVDGVNMMIKRWNAMNVVVDGQEVTAQLWSGSRGVKRPMSAAGAAGATGGKKKKSKKSKK